MNIYVYIFLGKGYPSILSFIEEKDFLILAMDLLGPSLEDLLNFCQRQFSKKTVLMLIDQAISCIQLMHERSLIHRDVCNEKKTLPCLFFSS
jgi:serine/threonine protein kinase